METDRRGWFTAVLASAIAEAATGLALLVVPSLVGRLLLGTELTGVAIPVARVTGIALIALGVACWPGCTVLCGMLTYNALAAAFFVFLGIRGHWVGLLLWPAAGLHAAMAILLGRAWLKNLSPAKPPINKTDQP
ncbi:MAG: hypothetical protein NT154_34435 [Verrucomicrobia bacterium]|nr:hypothetical protein [Verrucomicrobiota bacterium]